MDQGCRVRRSNSEGEEDEEENDEEDEDSRSDYSQDFQQSEDSGTSSDSSSDRSTQLCPAAQLLLAKNNNITNNNNNQSNNFDTGKKSSTSMTAQIHNQHHHHHHHNQQQQSGSNQFQRIHKMSGSLFMQERLSEEDETEEQEDDRPIRCNMKIREDTMDGAENPDTDPPQRRKTLEDISITELSALRASMPPEYPDDHCPPTLLPCLTCNRTFNVTALDRHRKVCQKLTQPGKKKQIFNPLKQRFECPDEPNSSAGSRRAKTPERKTTPPSKKPSRWREKHQEFLRTIRAARGTPEGDADAGKPVSTVPSDYVQCPHCERHFGPKAADRHIDWCREQRSRLRRDSADVNLMERLKTRTKYVPPKPGQSGWRAPKKTDVISSIPPTDSGSERRLSPPSLVPPVRRGTSPGPPPHRQYGSSSLGRAAARSFSSLLQAVNNSYSSPYGQRPSVVSASGYATPSSYSAYGGTHGGGSVTPNLVRSGSFSGTSPGGSFSRSQSMRAPNSRRSSGGRIARRRDLASDMLASVCLGASPARGEPEGDEADDFSSRETTLSPPPPYIKSLIDSKFDSSFENDFNSKYDSEYDSKFDSKYDDDTKNDLKYDTKYAPKYKDTVLEPSYDPYSAAEMQMQALLGPTKTSLGSGGLGAAGMGIGTIGAYLENNNEVNMPSVINSRSPKPQLSKLKTNLSPLVSRRSARGISPSTTSDLLSSSPRTDFNHQSKLWRLSPSPPPQRVDRWSPSPQSPTHAWSPTRNSPSRWVNDSYSWNRDDRNSITSLSGGSRYSASSGNTSHRDERGVSPSMSNRDDRFSLSSGSGSIREDRYSSGSLSRDGRFSSVSSASSRADRFSLGSNPSSLREDRFSTNSSLNTAIHRTLGNGAADISTNRKISPEDNASVGTISSLSSLKVLRTALQANGSTPKKNYESFSEVPRKADRTSSDLSTETSLPVLSPLTLRTSSAALSKSIRGDTVGGHKEETSNINSTSRIDRSSLSAFRTDRSTLSGDAAISPDISTEESLLKAISSLSSIANSTGKPDCNVQDSTAPVADSKVPRFCHECGHKYPVSLAKFCCQCGCRRVPSDH